MRKGFLGSITGCLAGAGLALAQSLTPSQLATLPTSLPVVEPKMVAKPAPPAPSAPPAPPPVDEDRPPPPDLPQVGLGLFTDPSVKPEPPRPVKLVSPPRPKPPEESGPTGFQKFLMGDSKPIDPKLVPKPPERKPPPPLPM